jgi:16S rRNA processing protein RimM
VIRIGKIAATHGLTGDVILAHELPDLNWLKAGEPLHLELKKGSFIPFFVEGIREKSGTEAIIRLDDVPDVTTARELVGRPVYVANEKLSTARTTSPLRFIGYKVVDVTLGALGTIDDVYKAGPQWLAQIDTGTKKVLFPLIEAFIKDTNDRNRFLRVQLPDGLVDL